MPEIPPDVVDRMMVTTGRHCCVCRRFRPTKLQVHHIVERANGGTNDPDNLFVVCLPCHTDVHSVIPFARRFTANELRLARDTVVKMVAEGRLVAHDAADANVPEEIIRVVLSRPADVELSPASIELLVAAADCIGDRQGAIDYMADTLECVFVNAGKIQIDIPHSDGRRKARYKAAINQLRSLDLIEGSDSFFHLTEAGYLRADELASEAFNQRLNPL